MIEFFEKMVSNFQSSIMDVWQRSKYQSGSICHLNSSFSEDEDNSGPLSFLLTWNTQFIES